MNKPIFDYDEKIDSIAAVIKLVVMIDPERKEPHQVMADLIEKMVPASIPQNVRVAFLELTAKELMDRL